MNDFRIFLDLAPLKQTMNQLIHNIEQIEQFAYYSIEQNHHILETTIFQTAEIKKTLNKISYANKQTHKNSSDIWVPFEQS